MPLALATVWQMLKETRSKDIYNTLMKFNEVLGFNFDEEEIIPVEIKELAKQRWEAKLNKNWAVADEIRNKLTSLGYEINKI